MMKYIKILLVISVFLVSCEDFLDPKISEERSYEQLLTQPGQIKGLVSFAYRAIPGTFDNYGGDFLDCATDNAVSNNISGALSRTAEIGSFWSASRGAFSNWNARYEEISNINQYFEIMANHDILFLKSSEDNDSILKMTTTGEAYFLRAWCHFDLLKIYGGKDVNGNMKGVPLIKEVIEPQDFLNVSRPSYDETVTGILEDIDSAMLYLPTIWNELTPNKYLNLKNLGRPTDAACLMLKSRVLLYAASPAFTDGLSQTEKDQKWLDAAIAAKEVIDLIGFSLPPVYSGNLKSFYNDPQNRELILRKVTGNSGQDRTLEINHSLPTLYGSGNCNPTQNLVDAFPMSNGYPINEVLGNYDADSMYKDRDPRFYMTILYNGANFGGTTVETFIGGKDMAGGSPQADVTNSTRTGYYLRKWLSNDVRLASGVEINDYHYAAIFRNVEMHLNFAEAANEAVGPKGNVNGLSAEEALLEVRRRAGIPASGSDDYLSSQAANANDFRELIRNERRIELCFEGHRFFDLRRWKDVLNRPIYKIDITKVDSVNFTYEKTKLVDLAYDNTRYYCPIPQNELNKTPNLTQNENW